MDNTKLKEVLEKTLAKMKEDGFVMPEVPTLAAQDICRLLPMRNNQGQKCLTGWATDTFLHGQDSAKVFMAFRVAFQIVALEMTGKHYQHMGPFNDDGKQTEEQIADAYNQTVDMLRAA